MSFLSRLSPSFVVAVLGLVGIVSLAFALIGQYGFDLRPCVLCLYQRVPYGVMIAVCALALLAVRRSEAAMRWTIVLCALLMVVGGGIAFYQAGVEQHWWAGPDGCSGTGILDVEKLQLENLFDAPPPARCDEIPWALFGLSLAAWNTLFSFAVAAGSVLYLKVRR